ncbi:MAG: HAMP domain-containing sensor histidine kinase [Acidobacteria bacterium]|nr:HAMP domain-containing sensor histidine kinase [Acidobacteriota bacterium]
MTRRRLVEWGLIGLMIAASAVLAGLQYQWIGEVSAAEQSFLKRRAEEQVKEWVAQLGTELNSGLEALTPSIEEIEAEGRWPAHGKRLAQWSGDREMFGVIAVAVPKGTELSLFGYGRDLKEMDWPVAWKPLKESLHRRLEGGGPPPNQENRGLLIERPVFGSRGEDEWVIAGLNRDFIRKRWSKWGGDFDVELKVGKEVAYQSRVGGIGKADLTIENRGGRFGLAMTVGLRHKEGSLAEVVERARIRNLVTAFALIGMLLVAGFALLHYTKKTRELAAMQLQFVAGVSHELRTPLTVITGAAHNLLSGVVREPKQVERYAKLIADHARQLTGMVEQVMEFSRRQAGEVSAVRERVRIVNWIESAVEGAAPEIAAAECEVELDLEEGLPMVAGDPGELQLALQNLVVNAAKHGGEGNWIGVSARRIGQQVEVAVSDHGPGVPASEREKIFDPFYRGERAVVDQVRVSGLGLSLLREIVEKHGGTVVVREAAGGGAEFAMRLPVSEEIDDEFTNTAG